MREELEPFLERSRSAGAPVARFVEREIRAYLDCGVLAHGFLLHGDFPSRWEHVTEFVHRRLADHLPPITTESHALRDSPSQTLPSGGYFEFSLERRKPLVP